MAISYPNLTTNITQTSYDIAGFVTADNQTWDFIIIYGNNKSKKNGEKIFSEEIRPLWFTVAVDDNDDDFVNGSSIIKRIIYKRDSLISPYIVVQMDKNGVWNLQSLPSSIRYDDQCFYDATNLYCFGKIDGNQTKISRINFCGFDEICVENVASFSSKIVGGKIAQILDYNSCSTTIKFKDEKNVTQFRNLYNLQDNADGNLDVSNSTVITCHNDVTSNLTSSSFSTINFINSFHFSLSLQYRIRKPFISTCQTNNNAVETCLKTNASNKKFFQIFFYSIISVFAIYILVNVVFLLLMFYRRRKMIQNLSQCFTALKEMEKSEELNSEKKQTTLTSNKETENKSAEKTLVTARQPRIFMNESIITADLLSSKRMEEPTGGKNES